jgi:hypothetical protein
MSDELNRYLRGTLKRWLSRQEPPANIRARLIIRASTPRPASLELLEEWMIPKPKTPEAYLGFPMRDLPGLVDFSWAVPLRMPI